MSKRISHEGFLTVKCSGIAVIVRPHVHVSIVFGSFYIPLPLETVIDADALGADKIREADDGYCEENFNTISHGNQPKVPICLIAVDYGEIQNMRFQLNYEQFEKIAQELKLTDEEYDHLYNKFFVNLDQKHQIEVKRTISYDTQTKKDGAIAKRSYDGNDEYMKTVHPVAF